MAYEVKVLGRDILKVRFEEILEKQDWDGYMRDFEATLQANPDIERLHFLVDVQDVSRISAAARKALIETLRSHDPRAGSTGVIGTSRYIRVLASFVLKAVGREDFRLFEREEEALEWLRQKSQASPA